MYARFFSDMLNQRKNKKVTEDKNLTTLSSSSVSRAFALKKNLSGFLVNSEHSSELQSSSIKQNGFQVSLSIISSDSLRKISLYKEDICRTLRSRDQVVTIFC